MKRLFLASLLLSVGVARAQLQVGDAARALDLPSLDGKILKVEELRGRVVAVDFFATWCSPCISALAALDEIARTQPGLSLVIVDVGEEASLVKQFFQQHPPPASARVVLDRNGEAARRWGARRFPTTFVLDVAGVVRHINRGFGPGYFARLSGWIRGLLPRL
jgi:cytochrome c biogenesis protein CcmG, thiol:disulfide interchange protein DsbE